jgi:AraC-like DNA-binding protein
MESSLLSRSSKTFADPLSDVLSLLRPRGYMSGGMDAGGDWSLQFEEDGFLRCFAIASGQCWLSKNGGEEPVLLGAGDFVVLPHGQAFRLASDLTLAPIGIMSVITRPLDGRVLCWQGGGDCLALSALFTFDGYGASFLLGVLPPVAHIRKVEARAAMQWYLERMMKVIREPQPGGLLLGEHLAQMMLIEVLGLSMAENASGVVGWLSALADRQIGAAISALHENLGYRWTLQGLAEHVGMSRSALALRFKQKVGISAMDYLTRWRMLRAGEMLINSRDPVSTIALSLGYESESAFSFAFKREMGSSPRQFCREQASGLARPA